MTPIESPYDIRFLTLAGVAMNALGELAVLKNESVDLMLAESLFLVTKRIHEEGEEETADRLMSSFSILKEAIV